MLRSLALCCLAAAAAAARVGDSWGTNIHWTAETQPGEAAMLARAFRLARMDFGWARIESKPGVYDFSAYDGLLAIMEAHGVRPYWILDYGNPLYPPTPGSPSNACNTETCIAAFGALAAAAAAHFHGHSIIWETVNEPNGMGQDNATDLAALARACSPAFANYGETFVGPATAGMDFVYIEQAFAAGILTSYTNVSVHPYRGGPPESVLGDWLTLAALIEKYSPGAPRTMLDGEWGYTSAAPPCRYGNKVPPLGQAKYLARMWLLNALAGATVSIAYDWRDDGTNLTDCESNFGSVHSAPTGSPAQPFAPKPAYLAALAAQAGVGSAGALGARVPPASGAPALLAARDVFILRFDDYARAGGGDGPIAAYAAWTNATTCAAPLPPGPSRADCGFSGITLAQCSARGCCWDAAPPPPGQPQCFAGSPVPPTAVSFALGQGEAQDACFLAVNVTGGALPPVCATAGVVSVALDDGPLYLL